MLDSSSGCAFVCFHVSYPCKPVLLAFGFGAGPVLKGSATTIGNSRALAKTVSGETNVSYRGLATQAKTYVIRNPQRMPNTIGPGPMDPHPLQRRASGGHGGTHALGLIQLSGMHPISGQRPTIRHAPDVRHTPTIQDMYPPLGMDPMSGKRPMAGMQATTRQAPDVRHAPAT